MDNYEYERKYYEKGCIYIAGVDEVGRGPLAGPVVCASVIMPKDKLIDGVTDSKKLSEKKREALAKQIKEQALSYCIYSIEPIEIDQINILNAVKKCMVEAVKGLTIKPDITLVDGVDTGLEIEAEYITKGDYLSYTIGCASILAKVYRDNLMKEYAEKYPYYAFEENAGYGTTKHVEGIKTHGPTEIHRMTFLTNILSN